MTVSDAPSNAARRGGKAKASRARRTQEERSAAMRARVLEATIEALAERGYARMVTSDVLARGGVSRGAMLHHFPSKAVLVAAAIDHLFEKRITSFREAVRALPAGEDAVAGALALAWKDFTSPAWTAVLELLVAARSDAELGAQVRTRLAHYEQTIRDTAHELFGAEWSALEIEAGTRLIHHLLNGLALTHPLRARGPDGMDDETRLVFSLLEHGYALYAAQVPRPAPRRSRRRPR